MKTESTEKPSIEKLTRDEAKHACTPSQRPRVPIGSLVRAHPAASHAQHAHTTRGHTVSGVYACLHPRHQHPQTSRCQMNGVIMHAGAGHPTSTMPPMPNRTGTVPGQACQHDEWELRTISSVSWMPSSSNRPARSECPAKCHGANLANKQTMCSHVSTNVTRTQRGPFLFTISQCVKCVKWAVELQVPGQSVWRCAHEKPLSHRRPHVHESRWPHGLTHTNAEGA
jgi:hypothetical protein